MQGGSVCRNNSGDIQIWSNNCKNDIKSLKINNTITNNPKETANTFNDYFLTVTDTVNGNIKKDNNDTRDNLNSCNYLINNFNSTFLRINWNYATAYENDKIIKSLKAKNSYGYDKIHIKILTLSTPFIISSWSYISNKTLSSGVFPEKLKYAIIKPVYKKETNFSPLIIGQSLF